MNLQKNTRLRPLDPALKKWYPFIQQITQQHYEHFKLETLDKQISLLTFGVWGMILGSKHLLTRYDWMSRETIFVWHECDETGAAGDLLTPIFHSLNS